MYKIHMFFIFTLSLFTISCSKNNVSKPNPSSTTTAYTYTTGIGGQRNWHGHHFLEAHGKNFPTPIHESYALPDTSFAVVVLNDSTINCLGSVHTYSSSDSILQVHYFGLAKYYYTLGPGYGPGVAYFYGKDSIVYLKYQDSHGTNDYWKRDDHYYTY